MTVHTFSTDPDRSVEAQAGAALLAAAVTAVIVFWPPEGQVMAPLHETLYALLGRATFLIPLGLALIGTLSLVRGARPNLAFPRRRLIGLALIAVALLPGQRLLGESTGLIGDWLTGFLVELLGETLGSLLVVALVAIGAVLAFGINVRKALLAAR